MASILQSWVETLPLRHQGALLGAIRGCDTVVKFNPAKQLTRFLRGHVLVPHCGDPRKARSFIEWCEDDAHFNDACKGFFNEWDALPYHFVMHLVHAGQVIAYFHSSDEVRGWWFRFYSAAVHKMHLNMETKMQLDDRLNADEETFGDGQ